MVETATAKALYSLHSEVSSQNWQVVSGIVVVREERIRKVEKVG